MSDNSRIFIQQMTQIGQFLNSEDFGVLTQTNKHIYHFGNSKIFHAKIACDCVNQSFSIDLSQINQSFDGPCVSRCDLPKHSEPTDRHDNKATAVTFAEFNKLDSSSLYSLDISACENCEHRISIPVAPCMKRLAVQGSVSLVEKLIDRYGATVEELEMSSTGVIDLPMLPALKRLRVGGLSLKAHNLIQTLRCVDDPEKLKSIDLENVQIIPSDFDPVRLIEEVAEFPEIDFCHVNLKTLSIDGAGFKELFDLRVSQLNMMHGFRASESSVTFFRGDCPPKYQGSFSTQYRDVDSIDDLVAAEFPDLISPSIDKDSYEEELEDILLRVKCWLAVCGSSKRLSAPRVSDASTASHHSDDI